MSILCEIIGTVIFTYAYIYVFEKLSRYKSYSKKIKYIIIVGLIDFIIGVISIKPIRLGVYYIILELVIYLIYEKNEIDFFISYIITFWIFQISDIFLAILFNKYIIINSILNKTDYLYIITNQSIVAFLGISIERILSKISKFGSVFNFKEKKLLLLYTNTIILVYILLIYCYSISEKKDNIIIIYILVFCFFMFISYFIFNVLNKLDIEKNEKYYIEVYNNIIEESLNNMKSFRHDYKNIVLGIGGFLDTNDIEGLKKYFFENIHNNKNMDEKNLYGLKKIEHSPVRGLFYAKISRALSKKINLNVYIDGCITDFIIKDIDICKILGIVIDNAIEASVESTEKIVNILVTKEEFEIGIIISNSFKKHFLTSRIFERGYSTKGDNRGLGLSIVRELNEKKYPKMDISTKIETNIFHMEIILKK